MRRLAFVLVALLAVLAPASALAAEGDAARLAVTSSVIGQQSFLELTIVSPKGATVELDPAAASWNGIETVRIETQASNDSGDTTVHQIRVLVAPFAVGTVEFAPAVNVIAGAAVEARVLPGVRLTVLSSLAPGAPLELSPLAGPGAIDGEESPLLKPAIAGGGLVALIALAATLAWLTAVLRRHFASAPAATEEAAAVPGLDGAEGLLHQDPVAAYRSLASTVRSAIGERYGFPAFALTTAELQRRMEGHGVERWQARLVSGLLEECDAVVYAGYRPAAERREHDLTMAREILAGVV